MFRRCTRPSKMKVRELVPSRKPILIIYRVQLPSTRPGIHLISDGRYSDRPGLDRFGSLYALSYTVHLHKQEAPLSQLWPSLRSSMFEQITSFTSFRYHSRGPRLRLLLRKVDQGQRQDVSFIDWVLARGIDLELHSHEIPKASHHPSDARGSRSKVLRDADTDLQRAIQLSLEDAGVSGALSSSGYTPSQPPSTISPTNNGSTGLDLGDDPDLKAAIEASLRDVSSPIPSAPSSVDFPQPVALPPRQISSSQALTNSLSTLPNYDMDLRESDMIMTFTQTLEQARHDPNGRDITRYPALSQLYDQANGLRPKLAMSLDDTSRRESKPHCAHDIVLYY